MAGIFNISKANVGLFCDVFPPVMDGVSICVENYAYWLQKKVGGVNVITPNVPGTDYSKLEYKVLDYFSIPVPQRPPYVTGIAEIDPVFMAKVLKTSYKIVHCHSPFTAGRAGVRASKLLGVPMVATFHSKFRDDFSSVLPGIAVDVVIKLIIDFFNQADMVWVPQASVTDVIRDYGFKGHVEVMDNGSDLVADYSDEFFADARRSLGIGKDEFVMLFVGQHIWQKNPKLVIESLALMKEMPFRMFFIGTGYAAEDMKKLVKENGLDDKVTFVGTITDRQKMTTYYAASDLFLFPSLYDNAPLVVREAAALHTPAVMAKGATASTILVDGENGFLTENDPQAMSTLLRGLMADREKVRRVGLQASRTIVRSWEDCVDEVIVRYNDLLKSRGLPLIDRDPME